MSTDSIATAVREAAADRKSFRIAGGGSWMNAGRAVDARQTLSLASDKGIVDYVPDDLTITIRAGTTLDEIETATRANNQWLALDPPGSKNATIGATIATASSGPLAHSFGFARDFVLGLELVTGKADVIRSGGRVVKNVAGFDLMRLNCGAWGTLGVITEASLRLYALPKVDRTFALPMPADAAATREFFEALRNAPLAAFSMEAINATLAAALGLPRASVVLIRLAGNAKLVDSQLGLLAKIAAVTEVETGVWQRLREARLDGTDVSLRLSGLPGDAASLWRSAEKLVDGAETGHLQSTFSRGIVRVSMRGAKSGARLPAQSAAQRVAYEILPRDAWKTVSPSVISDALSQNVKRAFDPHGLLNPGILG